MLLIDIDPQGNATTGCGIDKSAIERGIAARCCSANAGRRGACARVGRRQRSAPLAVLPANQDLTAAEVRLLAMESGRERRLREALEPMRHRLRSDLIDCPPALNMLTVNALVAADSVLIPMQCEYYALEGLSALVATIEQIRATANPATRDRGHSAHHVRSAEQSRQRGQRAADDAFRREGVSHRRPAQYPARRGAELRQDRCWQHDPDSRGALAYLALAGEMLRREEELRDAGHDGRRNRRWAGAAWPICMRPEPTLGRGLRAARRAPGSRAGGARRRPRKPPDEELARLPLDLLQRGRYQPRMDMRPESLAELAESIRAQGVVQPIVVRPIGEPDAHGVQRYEIIAGERRWRAAQQAGLREIPAIIRHVPDEAAIAMALIENIQREDLNPLEEGASAAAADRGVRADAPAGGRGRRPLARRRQQSAAPAGAAARRSASGSSSASSRWAMRARCWACRSAGKQTEVALLVVRKGLSVRETESSGAPHDRAGRARQARRRRWRWIRISSAWRRSWPSGSGARVSIEHARAGTRPAGHPIQQPR